MGSGRLVFDNEEHLRERERERERERGRERESKGTESASGGNNERVPGYN